MIEGPAELVGLEVEPTLTAALIRDSEGADALPLLAFTLERLYRDYGSDGNLELTEYEAMGGVSGAIAAAVDDALRDPPRKLPADRPELEHLMRKIFIPHLVRIDAAGKYARRVTRRDELSPETWPLVDLLVERRLLLADRRETEQGEIEIVEIAHEALLREWPMLVEWLEEEREFFNWRERMGRASVAFEQGNRGLLDERELAIASGWLRTRPEDVVAADRELIERSETAATERLVRERRRSRAIMVSSSTAAIIFLIGALAAVYLWRNAADLRDAAEIERDRAEAAEAEAREARDEAVAAADRLAEINEQLRASRPLRVALADAPVTEVGASWYSVANTFSRATARVFGRASFATGVIVRGPRYDRTGPTSRCF